MTDSAAYLAALRPDRSGVPVPTPPTDLPPENVDALFGEDEPRFLGWVPSEYDERDYQFLSSIPSWELPASVDLSQPARIPVFSQGSLGSCGPQTACADIIHAALRTQGIDYVLPMPSRLFTYFTTREIMGTTSQDSGVDNRSMLKALNKVGWCDEALWPYKIGEFTKRPPEACFAQAATRRITEYLAVKQDPDQMRGCLAGGDPFIFGFVVYPALQRVGPDGIVPMPKAGERPVGGHDVLIVGYSDETQLYKFRNSWGTRWGAAGYGFLPYQYAHHPKLASDFWTVRHSSLPDPAPSPVPPLPPTPPPLPVPVPPIPVPIPIPPMPPVPTPVPVPVPPVPPDPVPPPLPPFPPLPPSPPGPVPEPVPDTGTIVVHQPAIAGDKISFVW